MLKKSDLKMKFEHAMLDLRCCRELPFDSMQMDDAEESFEQVESGERSRLSTSSDRLPKASDSARAGQEPETPCPLSSSFVGGTYLSFVSREATNELSGGNSTCMYICLDY